MAPASFENHTGWVRAGPIPRHYGTTFIHFLHRLLIAYPDKALYLTADSGSSPRSKKTWAWAAKQRRLHLTFTPTNASRLNLIDIWFGKREAIHQSCRHMHPDGGEDRLS